MLPWGEGGPKRPNKCVHTERMGPHYLHSRNDGCQLSKNFGNQVGFISSTALSNSGPNQGFDLFDYGLDGRLLDDDGSGRTRTNRDKVWLLCPCLPVTINVGSVSAKEI